MGLTNKTGELKMCESQGWLETPAPYSDKAKCKTCGGSEIVNSGHHEYESAPCPDCQPAEHDGTESHSPSVLMQAIERERWCGTIEDDYLPVDVADKWHNSALDRIAEVTTSHDEVARTMYEALIAFMDSHNVDMYGDYVLPSASDVFEEIKKALTIYEKLMEGK